jgi:hypothetical protein
MVPVVLQPYLGDVLASDHASHTVISVQNYQVAQTHGAKEPVVSTHDDVDDG